MANKYTTNDIVAKKLRLARGSRKQDSVARKLGMSADFVSNKERGLSNITVNDLARFAEVYKKPILFFLSDIQDKKYDI